MKKRSLKQISVIVAILLICTFSFSLFGCDKDGDPKLDPKNPLTITVWHYYTGALENAFNSRTQEFNDTVGKEKGIIVEAQSFSLGNLEQNVLASAKNEVGSLPLPNIFSAYADTAFEIEKLGLLADLGTYFKQAEQQQYVDSYIEEGRIKSGGELRIFPVAKSTEVLWINETDWLPFAEQYGHDYDKLLTYEGLTAAAADYYEWTDAKTPEIANDGKAFFGRDSMANLFLAAYKSFSKEIFQVSDGKGTLKIDNVIMKKLWDYYYVPFISGYFSAEGRYRSDNAKVEGGILSYVGSTASAPYAPSKISTGDETYYNIVGKVLPAPGFDGGSEVLIQQGAGMVVSKGTDKQEYASIIFLKWFTDTVNNSIFSAATAYMPVKKDAVIYDTFKNIINEKGQTINPVADDTLKLVFSQTNATYYAGKAFDGGVSARSVLENHLAQQAKSDRVLVLELINSGTSHADAVAQFDTDTKFNTWLESFTAQLNQIINNAA